MIVIEVPQDLKPLAGAFSTLLEKVAAAEKHRQGGRVVPYEDIEVEFGDAVANIERAAHAATLAFLDVDAERILVQGKTYNRSGRQEGVYYSRAGESRVERTVYREAGIRNGEQFDPIARRVGAVASGWLPKAAQGIAFLMQQGTEREAAATVNELGTLRYSSSTFKRVGHEVGHLYRDRRADIEDQLIQVLEVPDDATSISIALDRVSVPMEEERKRPPGRPRKNAPKRNVERNYRMAWCGTMTLHSEDTEAIHTIRYGGMPSCDVERLCGRMAADVHFLVQARPDLRVTLLADGAHEMWNLLETHFPDSVFGSTNSRVDFWHTIEKLAAAANTIHGDQNGRLTIRRWKQLLRRKSQAVDDILEELRASGKERVRVGKSLPVHEAITYLENHRERMNYAAARRAGLPIGSGNVEATCKSLFEVRMKRCGSRWHEDTGEDIVQLRVVALSDRWDSAMEKLWATCRTAVRVG
jgi:hypothetical protein